MADTTQWRLKPSKSRHRRSRSHTTHRKRETVPLRLSQDSQPSSSSSPDESMSISTKKTSQQRSSSSSSSRSKRRLTKHKHNRKHYDKHKKTQKNKRNEAKNEIEEDYGPLFIGDKGHNNGHYHSNNEDEDDDDVIIVEPDETQFQDNKRHRTDHQHSESTFKPPPRKRIRRYATTSSTSTLNYNNNNNNNVESSSTIHDKYFSPSTLSSSSSSSSETGLWSDYMCWRPEDGKVRHEVVGTREVKECDQWFVAMNERHTQEQQHQKHQKQQQYQRSKGHGKEPMVLIVAGPTGCGKTTLIRRKAAQYGWDIEEWDNYAASTYLPDMPEELRVRSMNRLESLRQFLSHSARYVPLTFTNNNNNNLNNNNNKLESKQGHRKVITLVEELPFIPRGKSRAERDQVLRDIISSPNLYNPIVFMINTHGCTSVHSALARIFPISILDTQQSPHPRVRVLKMKPITNNRVAKVLRDVCQRYSVHVRPGVIDDISERAAGDLRAAIQQLQLHCIGGDGLVGNKNRKRNNNFNKQSNLSNTNNNNNNINDNNNNNNSLLTSGGRLTELSRRMALRGPPPPPATQPAAKVTQNGSIRCWMRPLEEIEREDAADEIYDADYHRRNDHDVFVDVHRAAARILHATRTVDGQLKHNVEDVRTAVHAAEDRMVEYIHHNMYNFTQDIDDIGDILEGISAADPLLDLVHRNPTATRTTTDMTSFPVYGFHIAARSYIEYNRHPTASRFLPIRGPQIRTVQRTADSRAAAVQQMPINRARINLSSQRETMTEIVPFVKRLWKQAGLDGECMRMLVSLHQYQYQHQHQNNRTVRGLSQNDDDEMMDDDDNNINNAEDNDSGDNINNNNNNIPMNCTSIGDDNKDYNTHHTKEWMESETRWKTELPSEEGQDGLRELGEDIEEFSDD